ncbi:LysR family transcriptional regulator [Rhizobium leguminosarum]|uniref:LysR family transcriptional regulator n=1 Tax=Rhizobium leguminosarum TaxID=384 RepID=UPI001C9629AD|nr:LysR family transcriptional regulator [Rhizobium leguminosarum]
MAQNHRHLDWNDLRCVLAVAEHGGLAAAARALGVNHTTVLRRVNAFEEAQGLRLFERLPTGYLLTPGGEELLASVRQISSLVTDLERRLTGRDLRLEGVLRVATTDTLASSILLRHLAAFRVRYPDIVVELAVGNLPVDLVHHDVDAAIRPMAGPSSPRAQIACLPCVTSRLPAPDARSCRAILAMWCRRGLCGWGNRCRMLCPSCGC